MSNIHEEEQLGKPYDTRLLKRLLSYAKSHVKLLSVSIVMVLLIISADLTGPYLIKVAIDDHINGLRLPMADVTGKPLSKDVAVTEWDGKTLVRIKELSKEMPELRTNGLPKYQIVEQGDDYYLVAGIPKGDNLKWTRSDKGNNIQSNRGESYSAIRLTDKQVQLFRKQDVSALYRLSALYLMIISVTFLLNYSQIFTLNLVAQRIIQRMRTDIFSHLQRLSFRYFDRNPVGRLVTRVTNDTQTLNDMYSNVMISLMKDVLMLLGIMIVMWQLNSNMAMLAYVTLPIIVAATIVYRKYARQAMREVRTKLSRINASLNENISGMRIVQIFNREKQQYEKVHAINRSHFEANTRELHLSSLYRPIMDFIYAASLALLIWWAGGGIVRGALEFGVLYAFIDYINRFFKPIQDMSEKFTILQQSMVSSERIFQLLDEKDDLPDPVTPVALKQVKGEIHFRDVSFAYNEGDWVLRDIDLHIKPGETVAFVGATGAGKSSIISLLCRFYDVQKGTIEIDGIPIRDMDKRELRRHIGLVLQDVFLFSDDIKSNIRLSNEHITDEDIKRICEYVNASSFIEKLPKGYDEKVMERGVTFSSGQRQLLSIARTLAFDPSILVLDEATANIDTETELLIQDAIRKVSVNRTTLIIAHRLSTIQHADKIVVLHKGRIREVGTHQELLSLNGLYRKLYELQYKESFSA